MKKSSAGSSGRGTTSHDPRKTTSGEQKTVPSKRKHRRSGKDTMETQEYQSEAGPNGAGEEKKIRERLMEFAERIKTIKIQSAGQLEETNITIQEIHELCLRGRERFMSEPPLIKTPAGICVFGDIHGHFADLSKILDKTGVPPKQRLLFLGDYVDRGSYGTETITLLVAYKILYPKHIYLLRGNHETRAVNRMYGFLEECRTRFGEVEGNRMYTLFSHVFNSMPLAAVIAKKIFCCHGGISEHIPYDITDIGLLCDTIWADPMTINKRFDGSPRGVSKVFGQDAINDFCDMTNIDLVIRAHQCVSDGVEATHDDRCLTVFSAPYYCQESHNLAGVAYVDTKLQVQCYQHKSSYDPIKQTISES
ncbi:unnamed protein product [Bursaphelenchus xylophilus]|uniref:Serine/threonine-protein phosphatase n=1 Tax=Bursaphelenchus xylophilus TaxID=6326 RepID=A0A7I8WUC8_BURXY|nr:unnamed protein product [Bursaphelenchus xylophilus]CAG9116622.1 unnamed protein product [Bursaphelenchus xylophilus]